jgi:general secretion pathway protein A
MDYLEYFGLSAEPFSHAPVSRYYYASRQHTEALKRLLYAVNTMKGLAVLIGDIGHGKTTLARRLLDALPESEFEAAMLVIVHAGVTANWLLKRIAAQLGVKEVADDKLAILSQLYERLVEIHRSGKRAVVLIDEAQMLATRELMEEFRGLLNLEVPGFKLISFVFFGLPDIDNNLKLDPPLAQRVALRCHLKSLTLDETTAYVQHRLRLVGAAADLFPVQALAEVHRRSHGVPRIINTLCDNIMLEMYFCRAEAATPELVAQVAHSLGLDQPASVALPAVAGEQAAVDPHAGEDAIVAVTRSEAAAANAAIEGEFAEPTVDADQIAARVATEGVPGDAGVSGTASPDASRDEAVDAGPPAEPLAPAPTTTTLDIDDPLAFLATAKASAMAAPAQPQPTSDEKQASPAAAPSPPPEAPNELEVTIEAEAVAEPDAEGGAFVEDDSLEQTQPIALPESLVAGGAASLADVVAPPPPVLEASPPAKLHVAPAAPAVAPRPSPQVAPSATTKRPTKTSIDLSEIDDLLADLKRH